MNRTDFDRRFAATDNDTDGYTAAQIVAINDAVFAEVAALDLEDDTTKSIIDHAFERQFARADAA